MEEGGVLLQRCTERPVGDLLAVGYDQTLQMLKVGWWEIERTDNASAQHTHL